MKKYNFENFDILFVDAEGLDDMIVEWFLEAGYRPLTIEFERQHLPEARKKEIIEKLSEYGYITTKDNNEGFFAVLVK